MAGEVVERFAFLPTQVRVGGEDSMEFKLIWFSHFFESRLVCADGRWRWNRRWTSVTGITLRDYREMNAALRAKMKSMRAYIEELERDNEELTSRMSELQHANEYWQERFENADCHARSYASHCGALKAELEYGKREIASLQASVDRFKTVLK